MGYAIFVGGITPSYGFIKMARLIVPPKVQLHVLIRPRRGDFLYTDQEFEVCLTIGWIFLLKDNHYRYMIITHYLQTRVTFVSMYSQLMSISSSKIN